MSPLKAIYILSAFIVILLVAVMAFNYTVDPQCYYNCSEVIPERYSTNTYYHVAQSLIANPDTEIVVVGSSRAGTTSPLWIQEVTGQKALNISAAGAEVFSRAVFLELALQKTKVKKVIWYADYFELIGGLVDKKITKSPALRKYANIDAEKWGWSDLQTLIDRNTLEASFHAVKSSNDDGLKLSGANIDYRKCAQEDYPGGVSQLGLSREIDILYESYVRGIFSRPQSQKSIEVYDQLLDHLQASGVEVLIVVAPYNPEFTRRLKTEHPDIYQKHLEWIEMVKSREGKLVKVIDYFEGFPGEKNTPQYWDDGVHFNCHSVIKFVGPLISQKKR
ncbi:hypothetical protein D3C87_410460 [compost metagenome]